ncbi:MAG TPA: CPBP family intramembrane glutamic endopeptidase [Burkholderiaceae bacterium]|nr:CPBP family intramembrane glutamic endopeptidase [Burkholderiaceae bacterium]
MSPGARHHRWSPHLRGHLLLFDQTLIEAPPPKAGVRLLLAATFIEGLRLSALRWLSPSIPLWLLLAGLLALGLVMMSFAGVRLSQLGLRPWSEWSTTEKSYFCQVVAAANIVFPILLAAPLGNRIAQAGLASSLANVVVPYLLFGFYQELVYRAMVQTEAVCRWGSLAGVLVANLLYTFGPLHWDYFASPASLAVPMFASIFAIGLFFGVLYRRSGNLWIVAAFHAIGNAYIVLSLGPTR